MDPLESFIITHKSEFESELPSKRVWEAIEGTLDDSSSRRIHWRRRRVAFTAIAAVGLLFLGLAIGLMVGTSPDSTTFSNSLTRVDPQRAEAELYFHQAIMVRLNKVHQAGLSGEITEDLDQLADQMTILEAAFEEALPSQREYIIHSMIRNYQIRIELLETVLQETNLYQDAQSGQHENQKTSL